MKKLLEFNTTIQKIPQIVPKYLEYIFAKEKKLNKIVARLIMDTPLKQLCDVMDCYKILFDRFWGRRRNVLG